MKLSIILPCRNQSERLLRHMKETLFPYFDASGLVYEVIIVVNNSDEENCRLMEEAKPTLPLHVRFLPFDPQRGKGRAIRRGIEAADGDYVLFMDADFATDLHGLDPYIHELNKYDCLIGSRQAKGAVIVNKRTLKRRFISWCSRILIKMMFHFKNITDTQCGFKLFKTSIAKKMAAKQIVDEFAFDVEYLYYYKLNGYQYAEFPVRWTDDLDSTIKSPYKAGMAFYKDMRRIKKNKKNYIEPKEGSAC